MTSQYPSSVRQLYAPPPDDFLFLPPTLPPSSSSVRPKPVLVLPESARPSSDSLAGLAGLGSSAFTDRRAREALLWSAAGSLFSSFLAQPFETGKVLSQVQYLPKQIESSTSGDATKGASPSEEDQEPPELMDEDDAQAYFEDLVLSGKTGGLAGGLAEAAAEERRKAVDADGYVLSTLDEPQRGEWIMKRTAKEKDGPWSLTKRLWRQEGPAGPWKGFWVAVAYDALSHYIPPLLLPVLTSLSPSASRSTLLLPPTSPHILLPLLASHSLAAFVLSPLDLLRTRLIAQPLSKKHRSPLGPTATSPSSAIHSLSSMSLPDLVAYEGGWFMTYFHPTLFWPTVWDVVLRSSVSLLTPVLLEHVFHVSLANSPVTYRALEAIATLGSLLITLPIETARRRLQLQSRSPEPAEGGAATTRHCVQTRRRPYVGMIECLWRIVSEEEGGIRGLYRGFGLNALANGAVFGLEVIILAIGGERGGWREI